MAKTPARKKPVPRRKPERSLLRLVPRHGAFPLAIVAGLLVLGLAAIVIPAYAVTVAINAAFATHLLVVFIEMPRLTPEFLKERAGEQDVPVAVIFAVTVAVVALCVGSLFLALDGGGGRPDPVEVTLGVISVVLGWFVIHTMAALHYAYEYYVSSEANPDGEGGIAGGLEWPDESDEPDGGAFIYLAYQVGTAVQIADLRATSNKMRAIITTHAVFAFFYNTILIATAVNVALSAAGGS